MTSSLDRNCKCSERTFSTPAISKATSKLFSSQGCSDDESCRYFPAFSSKFRNSIQSAFAVSFHSMRSDARIKFDSGVIFLDLSQFFATHSNQWDCFTYGGSFDTTRVLKSRPLPTLVNTGKATWQNLLSIQNEILNCKYDLIPLSFSPSGAYAHFIRCAYCCNINVSDYTTAFVGKWTSC